MTAELVARAGEQRLSEIPLGRFGTPEDIAGVVRFLCGPDSAYVTGQLITVDGGTLNSS
jgi:NAD(P)-dependent dehydrogenase (short-subunit alcohol dehydrogenase family)